MAGRIWAGDNRRMEWFSEQVWILGQPVSVGLLLVCPAVIALILLAVIAAAAFGGHQRKDSE